LRLALAAAAIAGDAPIRLLAVSDERAPALDSEINRAQLGRLDGILGCGDLEPAYLCFLADAFAAPLALVRGNHDRGAAWEDTSQQIAQPLDGRIESMRGIDIVGLSWPGQRSGRAERSELSAWWQAIAAYVRARRRGRRLRIVISHAPPRGHGDVATDPYHTGFAAYAWLCRRLRPLLWLHGHTPTAGGEQWRTRLGQTTLANVTGAVLIELHRDGATIADK
jgi:Icc-related predicted phosphoesterase